MARWLGRATVVLAVAAVVLGSGAARTAKTTVPPHIAPSVTTTTVPLVAQPTPAAEPSTTALAGWGCAAAVAYLEAHAAPGFTFMCTDTPGATILGHQAATCYHDVPYCPDSGVIAIADPCPAAYENEASNSWVAEGLSKAPIDPYGSC